MMQTCPKDAIFLNILITNYTVLEKVCGEGDVTGDWAKSGYSQVPVVSQQINLDDDENINFSESSVDATQARELFEEGIRVYYTRMIKRYILLF